MKRKLAFAAALVLAGAMTGCAGQDNYIQTLMLERAGVTESTDYKEYEDLLRAGELDEKGAYNGLPAPETPEQAPAGKIQITFAENSYLDITYYADAACTRVLDPENCYLDPGSEIYASAPRTANPYSRSYVFSEFRVWQYHDGRRTAFPQPDGGANLVLAIPSGYTGDSILVQALGKYEARPLTFSAVYGDTGGTHTLGGGVWAVNDAACAGPSAEVSPVQPYTVSYDYSAYLDDYYFESSTPQCFDADEENGRVVFAQTEIQDPNTAYAVRLHPYITITLTNEAYRGVGGAVSALTQPAASLKSLTRNGEALTVKNAETQSFDKLKCGDRFLLRVGGDYKVSVSGLTAEAPAQVGQAFEYAVTIPETVETGLSITVSKRTATLGGYAQKNAANAVLLVSHADGTLVGAGEEVNDTEKVRVALTPDAGYYLTGSDVRDGAYQKTMSYKSYVSDIDKILAAHPAQKFLRVTLPAQDAYGTCGYASEGGALSGEALLREGQKLTLTYTLTAPGCRIVRDRNPVSFAKGIFSQNSATASIVAQSGMDGTTLRREDYITVEKSEEPAE